MESSKLSTGALASGRSRGPLMQQRAAPKFQRIGATAPVVKGSSYRYHVVRNDGLPNEPLTAFIDEQRHCLADG